MWVAEPEESPHQVVNQDLLDDLEEDERIHSQDTIYTSLFSTKFQGQHVGHQQQPATSVIFHLLDDKENMLENCNRNINSPAAKNTSGFKVASRSLRRFDSPSKKLPLGMVTHNNVLFRV
jgi:hypothetical protein